MDASHGSDTVPRVALHALIWCFAILITVASPLGAATVTVVGAADIAPGTVNASLRRIDASTANRDVSLAPGTPVDLAISEGVWELTVTSQEYWAAPLIVTAASSDVLRLWQRTAVTGTFGEAPRPAQLRLRFASAVGGGGEPEGSTTCQTSGKSWTCPVPAAPLDLQFGLDGFATEFRWNVNAEAGSTTRVGRLDFTPGASVAGRLELGGREKGAVEKMEVSLSAANPGPTDKVRRLLARPNARGFFQFKGVPAGRYVVRGAGGGFVTPSRVIDVVAGLNAVMREPLVAATPRRVSVVIFPMVDVDGQPWLVDLSSRGGAASSAVTLVTQGPASRAGEWSASSVTPGDYVLAVRRSNGSVWKSEELTMPADDLTLPVLVDIQRVEGTVTLGDRPIAADLQFEGGETIAADERGKFKGSVAKLPDGKAEVLVTYDTPQISRHVEVEGVLNGEGRTVFDIHLPNTTIMGRTIDPEGSPVPFAILNIRSETAKLVEQPASDEDGRFQIGGLEPGTYKIQAEAFNKTSDVVDVAASDSVTPAEIDLVLRDQEEVRGEVMMGSLRIPSAEIFALPRNVATSFVPAGKADANGRFVLHLPPGTETYDVLVASPGFANVSGRIVRNPKQILHVETVQTGGSLSVRMPATASPVIVRREGGEFQLSWLAWKLGATQSEEGEFKRITLPNLEPGRYEVCLDGRCVPAFVPPLASATVSVGQ